MYKFSENIQRGILYLFKNDEWFYTQIMNLVKPEYFEFPCHANIFSIVKAHHEKYAKIPKDDFIIEQARNNYVSPNHPLSDYTDELEYINRIDSSMLNDREYFVDIIEAFARKESAKEAIKKGIVLLNEGRIDEIEPLIRKAISISRIVDNGQTYFNDYQGRWERLSKSAGEDKYKTLLPGLNKSLDGGLGVKELAMVIAPPGVGKSLFLVNQAVTSLMENRKVLYVSLEMSEDKIAQRFDSVITMLPQLKLKSPASIPEVKRRMDRFQAKFDSSKLIIKEFPCSQLNANGLRAYLSQLHQAEDFVPDVICIDYLELMRPTKEIQHEYQAQQRIADELRGLAMEYKCLIWTATQTNRQGRSVRIITDLELGDCYGKIRPCDFAVSLNQTEEEYEGGTMRVYVVKSRNGRPRFTINAEIDYSNLTIMEGDEISITDISLSEVSG